MKTNGNQPAAPIHESMTKADDQMYHGLTKREAFAMAAMQGLLAFSHDDNVPTYNNLRSVADSAVVMADF